MLTAFRKLLTFMRERSTMSSSKITVHKDTDHPTKAWQTMAVKRKVEKVSPLDPSTPISDDKIRFVCMSDTHSQIQKNRVTPLDPSTPISDDKIRFVCMSDTYSQIQKNRVTPLDPSTPISDDKIRFVCMSDTHSQIQKNRVTPLDPSTPISDDKIRFVCMSDTHSQIQKNRDIIPAGDVILHAGDITKIGGAAEVKMFNDFMGELPHRLKIVIAGNHDLTFDDDMVNKRRNYLKSQFSVTEKLYEEALEVLGVTCVKELLANCIYLEDADITICGIKIHGSPWQPEFCDWGFNLPRGEKCLEKWDLIPDDTDILITHGPPIGHGDACFDGQRAGCVELLSTIEERVRPKYHVFGHIHEG